VALHYLISSDLYGDPRVFRDLDHAEDALNAIFGPEGGQPVALEEDAEGIIRSEDDGTVVGRVIRLTPHQRRWLGCLREGPLYTLEAIEAYGQSRGAPVTRHGREAVLRMAARLEAAGLIRWRPCRDRGGYLAWALTPDGRAVLE